MAEIGKIKLGLSVDTTELNDAVDAAISKVDELNAALARIGQAELTVQVVQVASDDARDRLNRRLARTLP